jgi:hypothetical protein
LIEEWLGESVGFIKYINNGHPVSWVRTDAPKEAHRIAEFLCFAQHVQYNQTNGLAYTSDYQGLLCDWCTFNFSYLFRVGWYTHRSSDHLRPVRFRQAFCCSISDVLLDLSAESSVTEIVHRGSWGSVLSMTAIIIPFAAISNFHFKWNPLKLMVE